MVMFGLPDGAVMTAKDADVEKGRVLLFLKISCHYFFNLGIAAMDILFTPYADLIHFPTGQVSSRCGEVKLFMTWKIDIQAESIFLRNMKIFSYRID